MLAFTSDGVVVGVVIRGVERYDLVNIKPMESEEEHWFRLWLRRSRSSENCIVGVASRSGRINQSQCSIPGLVIGWFFTFCFWHRQPSFHWIVNDGVVNGIEKMKMFWFSRLRFRWAYDSAYDSDFHWILLGRKLSYDSVASEDQS